MDLWLSGYVVSFPSDLNPSTHVQSVVPSIPVPSAAVKQAQSNLNLVWTGYQWTRKSLSASLKVQTKTNFGSDSALDEFIEFIAHAPTFPQSHTHSLTPHSLTLTHNLSSYRVLTAQHQ